ncbi:MAG: tetratricopeptide repeat protein, partial [Acidobacteria bacterium]|nr:tetratricopeptide repeat protein [Acidobacteriota bacterium]
ISFRITDVITRSPEAFRYYAEGIDLAFRYLHEEGIDRLRRAVQIDPTFAMAHLSLHMALRYFGLTEESLQALQKAVEHSRNLPEKEKLYVDAEEAYFIRQDPQEAVRIFEQITARYPNEWFPYFRMGSIVTREFGDDGRAIELYQKASQRNPDAPEIMNNLGYAYSRMGDYPMAIQFIEKYVALLPTDPNPQDSLGEVVFHSGDLDRAVREYRRVFEKNPQFYVSHRNVAYVHAVKGEYDAALSELSLAMSQSKGTPFEITCLVLRGVLAFYLGQYSKAESDFRHGLELAEKLKSYENGVFCAGMLGEMEFARARWKQGLEWNARASALAGRSPSVSRARLWQLWDSYAGGRAEVAQNHLKEAKAHLQAAEQSPEKPSGPQAQLGGVLIGTLRGEVLLLGGDAQRALEELRDARPPARRINLFNLPSAYVMHNLPFPQDGVARAYLALGRLEDAAQAYEDLLRFDSSDIRFLIPYPPYHAELGKVYERQGKRAEARAAYQRFLDLWTDADADQALPREVSARLKALS